MLRFSRSPLAWLAFCGLMAPAAARADLPAAWPVLPAATSSSSADSSASATSYEQDDTAEGDTVKRVSDSSTTFQTSSTTMASSSAASAMPSCGCSCMGDCRNNCAGYRPFIGVEAVFLAPVQHGGSAGNYTFNDGAGTVNSTGTGAVNGMIVTPRLWMGVMGERWGVGVRYWRFANGAGGGTFPGGTSLGQVSAGFLKLQTFDVEAIRRFCHGNSQLWFTVGARYAQFSQGSSSVGSDLFAGGLYTASAASGSGFNGTGITTGLYGLTPIGCSNWNLFYGGRASYLWDNNSGAFAQSNAAYSNGVTSGIANNSALGTGGNAGMFIGEVQLGAQYNHTLRCFPGTAFFRIAAEYQYWHVNDGATANSTSFTGPLSGSLVSASSSTSSSTLGLLGFGIATGFMW